MEKIIQIYINLLNEGTDVRRPVFAVNIKNDIYKILEDNKYDKENEEWEFVPGDTVLCENQKRTDGDMLVAVKKIYG